MYQLIKENRFSLKISERPHLGRTDCIWGTAGQFFFKSWISQGSVVFPIILFNMDSDEKDRVYGGVTEFFKA